MEANVNDSQFLSNFRTVECSSAQWHRQPEESTKAYAAFMKYCALGAERSLERLSQQHAKSIPLLKEWSARWHWVSRAAAYDKHLSAVELAAKEEAIKWEVQKWAARREEQREREWRVAEELIKRGQQLLAHPLFKQTVIEGEITVIEPVKWSMRDVVRVFDLASKLARLAIGFEMEDKNSRTDLTMLSDVELQRIAQGHQ